MVRMMAIRGAVDETGSAEAPEKLKVFRESFAALLFDLGGLAAGGIATAYLSLVLFEPWVIMIYPVVLGVRGAINGVLCGRLTTGLHVRFVEPSLRRNTRYYYALLSSVFALSIISSVAMGVIVFLINSVLYGISLSELPIITCACITISSLAVLMTVPFTSLFGFRSYRRGMDPDVFVYPISSTAADILATACFILTFALISWWGALGRLLVLLFGGFFCLLALLLSIAFRVEVEYWKTIKEALVAIVVIALIGGVSGMALASMRTYIERHPGLLMIYPALTNTLGDVGSIFGSLSTTKLALGTLEAKLSAIKDGLGDLFQIEAAALIMYSIFGIIAFVKEGSATFALVVLLSHFIALPVIITVSFTMAILTFIRGLDPDNFVIPTETAITDSLLTLTLAALIYIVA